MNRVLVALLVYCFSSAAFATTFVTISDFQLWSNTYDNPVIRVVASSIQNPESCSDADSYMVSTTLPTGAEDRVYAALLAAATADKSIQVVLSGCESGRPRIISVISL